MPDQIDEALFLRHSSPRNTFRALRKTFFLLYPLSIRHHTYRAPSRNSYISIQASSLCSCWLGTCKPSYVQSRVLLCGCGQSLARLGSRALCRNALAYPRRELGSTTPTMASLRLKILAFLRSVLRLVFGNMSSRPASSKSPQG
jgi:hypothetical protein